MSIKVEVTHPDRVLFPTDGITKGDLVDYYAEVAPVMLPHLKGRPLTLTRFPGGIDEEGFVQQNFAASLPDWMKRADVAKKGKKGATVVHPVAQRREALVWAANQDCITPHMWLSRQPRLHNPDRLVFDLDPSDGEFAVLRATARAVADILDDLGLATYVQTTGSRGLHVVTPLRGHTDFDTVRQFARDVAELVVADDPGRRTLEVRKDKRADRVYLDVLRNAYGQTAVAPYAVRARPGAPVATPLDWEELSARGMRADRFTLRDVPKRMSERGDPWADLRRHARSLTRARQRLAKLRG
ncbi:non-homologous end-joining DNA ligase [Mycobacterium talmoniae]|uniref:ATP-dependent DNA ligase n=1 Tax=Mycobacterium talmoniae TaxID=1858794 RepID=A0A1S1NDA4_9MYCO|nr:non-homologous end-joining DNA ligase [Mycobacterium talmoniae]OHU98527.1 ATP-dependent DNA ligase [Mycobacterium talmoniae]